MGNNQYPSKTKLVMDIMLVHKYDEPKLKGTNEPQGKTDNDTALTKSRTSESSFAQGKGKATICYCCGKTGHTSRECSKRDQIAKADWAVHHSLQYVQEEGKDTKNKEEASGGTKVPSDQQTGP